VQRPISNGLVGALLDQASDNFDGRCEPNRKPNGTLCLVMERHATVVVFFQESLRMHVEDPLDRTSRRGAVHERNVKRESFSCRARGYASSAARTIAFTPDSFISPIDPALRHTHDVGREEGVAATRLRAHRHETAGPHGTPLASS
jgi:hypothetical protein